MKGMISKPIECSVCGELIDNPRVIELKEGICLRCIEELAEDVDNCSPMVDEFQLSEENIEDVRFNGVQEKETGI